MNKILFFLITALIAIMLMSNTCNNGIREFSLQNGQSVTKQLNGYKYTIKVLNIKDSRCPMDTRCIRAGEAFVITSLSFANKTEQVEFCTGVDCRMTASANVKSFVINKKNYELSLINVNPDPSKTLKKENKSALFSLKEISN